MLQEMAEDVVWFTCYHLKMLFNQKKCYKKFSLQISKLQTMVMVRIHNVMATTSHHHVNPVIK